MEYPTSFEQEIQDTNSPIAVDLTLENSPLLIAFGGIAGGLAIPPFEFFNLTKGIGVNKIYVRDFQQAWYHLGLPEIGNSINDIAKFLKNKIEVAKITKTILVGNSMGGYAAILFGALLDADVVHAFSPQTFIDRSNRIQYSDLRWKKRIQILYNSLSSTEPYFDLKTALKKLQPQQCHFNIYYSSSDRLDQQHAIRMEDIANVSLHSFEEGEHELVKYLRDTGRLKNIIVDSLKDVLNSYT